MSKQLNLKKLEKFTTNDEFKRINQQYFDELLRAPDPKQLQKLKQAKDGSLENYGRSNRWCKANR